jgi:hypothetical protein
VYLFCYVWQFILWNQIEGQWKWRFVLEEVFPERSRCHNRDSKRAPHTYEPELSSLEVTCSLLATELYYHKNLI